MGVWGDKVFDGDDACDFVGHVIDHLANVVDEGLKHGRSIGTRKLRATLAKGQILVLHSPVVPAVATIRAIVAGTSTGRFCIGKRRVEEWKTAYLKWFQEEFVPANGPSRRYRRNAEKEFDELIRLAQGPEVDD